MEKKKLNELQIKELRKALKEELESITLKDDEYIKLDIDKDTLEQIIFITDKDSKRRTFAFDFNLIKKLDLTNISFDNVDIFHIDFSGSYGVKINPQTVWNKNFLYTKLKDTELIENFDDCNLLGTDFTGSIGAVINPKKVRIKYLHHQYKPMLFYCTFTDALVTDSLDECFTEKTILNGALCLNDFKNEIKQSVRKRTL